MEKKDIKNMSDEEVLEFAKKYASKNGFEVLEVRRLAHPDDYYMRFVLAYNESGKEYATWLLNLDLGGLHYGHYFSYFLEQYEGHPNKEKAYQYATHDFEIRK